MKRFVYRLTVLFIFLMLSIARGYADVGVCGTANGTAVPSTPIANLCAGGSPSAVSGTGPWSWSCTGSNGGGSASCTATSADRLGINLAGLTYYSPEIPFKDVMFQAAKNGEHSPSGNTTCQPQPEDADGYPLSIDTADGCEYQYYILPGAPYPTGHYVFTYNGTGAGTLGGDAINVQYLAAGRIEFDVQAAAQGIWITITGTSSTDNLRNFHMFLATDEATYQTQPFRQALLTVMSAFRIIRFMDWSGVSRPEFVGAFAGVSQPDANTLVLPATASATDNAYVNDVAVVNVGSQWPRLAIDHYDGATRTLHLASPAPLGTVNGVYIEDFPNRSWAQRTTLNNQLQQGLSGVAYEYMVALANSTNKDIWINIPTAADDDFVTQLATLLRNTLNPNLKIYIEYSNETWNVTYPGYDYSEAAQKVVNLVGSGTAVPADAWQPYRALQIFHLFNQVFGEADLTIARTANSHLVRVLTSQTGWFARFMAVANWTNAGSSAPTFGHHAYEFADALAVTDYWSFPTGFDLSTLQLSTDQFVTQMIGLQKQAIDQATASTGTNGSNYLYAFAQAAQALNIKLIAYEGGESFVPNQADATLVPTLVNDLQIMNHDPRMAGVYQEALTQWQQLSRQFPGTIGDWAQYNDAGACSQYGCWGLLDNLLQNPTTLPRCQGILNFLNANLYAASTF